MVVATPSRLKTQCQSRRAEYYPILPYKPEGHKKKTPRPSLCLHPPPERTDDRQRQSCCYLSIVGMCDTARILYEPLPCRYEQQRQMGMGGGAAYGQVDPQGNPVYADAAHASSEYVRLHVCSTTHV